MSTTLHHTDHPSLWQNRDYLLLWSGQAISTLGSQISQFASPLLVLFLTGSPGLAGLIASLVAFPIIFFALPAGAFIDRWDRKKTMIWCDIFRFLALGSIPVAIIIGHLTILQLVVTGLVEGSAFAFFTIAEISSLPRVVEKEQLATANSLNALAMSTAYMAGPALSGLLFSVGRAFPFVFDATSYLISVTSLLCIKQPFQQERSVLPFSLRVMVKEIGEGAVWLWKQQILRLLAIGAFVGNAVINGIFLTLIYEGTRLHLPASGMGILIGIYGSGGILGAVLALPLGKVQFGRLILTWQWFAPLILLFFLFIPGLSALSPLIAIFALAGAAFLSAAGEMLVGTIATSYRIAHIPDALQGRVNSVYRLAAFAGPPIGLALAGLLLQIGGLPLLVSVFATALVAVAILYTCSPLWRNNNTREITGTQGGPL